MVQKLSEDALAYASLRYIKETGVLKVTNTKLSTDIEREHLYKGKLQADVSITGDVRKYNLYVVAECSRDRGAVALTVGRSYVGNDVTHSTLLDRACACSYENLPKYRSYRVSNTASWGPLD